jgi:hypothetical protein
MDFSPEIEDYSRRASAFIEASILSLEADPANFDTHEPEGIRWIALQLLRCADSRDGRSEFQSRS